MTSRKQRSILRVGMTVALTMGAIAFGIHYTFYSPARNDAQTVAFNLSERADTDQELLTVKVTRPKRDPGFAITVQQLATVEPYFQADLRSKVAGPIKYLYKAIGDRIVQDEVLLEIDVPDQLEAVAHKEKMILERQQECRVSEARVAFRQAAVDVAAQVIAQRQAEFEQAEAVRAYRKKRVDRFVALHKLGGAKTINPEVVEDEERDYRSSEAACRSAALEIRKADADLEEKRAQVDAALADVELKQALLEVARKDRDRMLALADYAKIRAPFAGVIVERTVDPGDFVQSAVSSRTDPLLTVARTDVVTVAMKVPDNDAPFVGPDTEAVVQLEDFPGAEISARVTRSALSIYEADRTMRVEVDLFNGTWADYRNYVARSLNWFLAPLGQARLAPALPLAAILQRHWRTQFKGIGDSFPQFPKRADDSTEFHRLMPGMSGYMRLQLQRFQDSFLIPSNAVFSRGGKPYILVVDAGKARRVPVRVQVSDAKLAKIVVLEDVASARGTEKESARELTGKELIVTSRQLEIAEGQVVRTVLDENWNKEDERQP